jgi:hypothetical protein
MLNFPLILPTDSDWKKGKIRRKAENHKLQAVYFLTGVSGGKARRRLLLPFVQTGIKSKH